MSREMTTTRLEAFSDGVIAIVVTIMVLELRAPSQPTMAALAKVAPSLVSYALSFLVVAIMWVNHHHLIHAVHKVTAGLLWANLYLLFWMSLVPFVTDYLGKNHREPLAIALYGLDLTLCSSAFIVLREVLIRQNQHNPAMAEYHTSIQRKNMVSAALYLISAPLAYASIYASFFIFILIPAKYFLPEKRLAGGSE
jgi:uncharacterized membrane protein